MSVIFIQPIALKLLSILSDYFVSKIKLYVISRVDVCLHFPLYFSLSLSLFLPLSISLFQEANMWIILEKLKVERVCDGYKVLDDPQLYKVNS